MFIATSARPKTSFRTLAEEDKGDCAPKELRSKDKDRHPINISLLWSEVTNIVLLQFQLDRSSK
jgi:hypothetical protein